MTSLYQLAVRYSSDKLYFHSYIPMYEKIFAGMHVGRLLEIGIGYEHLMAPLVPKYVHGSSLWMWHDYFPGASVYSCDIRPEVLINDYEKKVWSTVCDQSKLKDLNSLVQWSGGDFDVIIDDGSHQHEHQILTASVLLPHLRERGVYVIEDVMLDKTYELAKVIGGEVWKGPLRCDDNLVVARKHEYSHNYLWCCW